MNMRRSLCFSEPSIARAGQVSTWKFHYTTATSLPKGARFKFDLQTKGRSIDWEIPSVDLGEGSNVIYAEMESGEILKAKEIETPDLLVPQYEFVLPSPVKIGGKITIIMGAPPKIRGKAEEIGNHCQLTIQRRRPFFLYLDPKGKGNYEEPEIFSIDIRGNRLQAIRILTPSFVAKNKRFDITVRFEDEFGNLTNYAAEDTLIELSYEHLRENLSWKLFIPETGFVILPNLYFNETGIYRIQLKNLQTKECFTSPPIKCFNEGEKNLFWGLLHGESERVDSTENIESCLRHFRDEKALNFFASSCFESHEETSPEIWKLICANLSEFNEEDRFITIFGFQYPGEAEKEGVRQLLYFKEGKPLLRQKEAKTSSLEKIYKSMVPKELISIPTFTMGQGFQYTFKNFNPDIERVVEIYNAWGSSERSAKEGNPRPITGGVEEAPEGSIIRALKNNYRFGFVAGGLDDRGIYGTFFDSEQVQYSPGLTAIICEKYTRDSLMDALYRRSCYATTGARMIVGFHVAGQPMGSELSSVAKPGLVVNRHLSGYVAGTAPLKRVEIIRNGVVIHTFTPQGYHFDYYFDDAQELSQVTLESGGKDPFVFYYLRVTQEDEHIAWSSPIWIDHASQAPLSTPKVVKKEK